LLWVYALKFTTTVRASIFQGTHPIILVFYFAFVRNSYVHKLEWFGVALSFCGLLIACSHTHSSLLSVNDVDTLFGDVICIGSAICEAIVILNREIIIAHVPVMQYTAATTVVVAITSSILAFFFFDCALAVDDNGLLGWISTYWIAKMFLFSFVVGVLCIAGFNYAMSSIPPLVFSSVLLIDPLITGLISWSLSIEGVPGQLTIYGGVVVIFGIFLVIYGQKAKNRMLKVLDVVDVDTGLENQNGDFTPKQI